MHSKSTAVMHKLLTCILPIVAAIYVNTTTNVTAPCDSPIFCQGDLLRDVELARPFSDSKTFVDMPTIKPVDQVLAAYRNLTQPLTNDSALQSFLSENFAAAGMEIVALNETLSGNATFLTSLDSSIVADFVQQIIDIWPTLTRQYVGSSLCDGCESSFIPLNRSFVVAGGRFREAYYWDSFWILEGLLRTGGSYTQISKNIILNFLDFIEQFGFVPNGARKYYLNRSQPPVLTQMVRIYMEQTNDTSILDRALPLLIKEQQFWQTNNTVQINTTSGSYNLSRYFVLNNQPRPESYFEDYQTVNNLTYYSNGTNYSIPALDNSTKSMLYSNLAAGAESGWDYSAARWLRNPLDASSGTTIPLQTLNTDNIIPVDLNSILYGNEIDISYFYRMLGRDAEAAKWSEKAYTRADAMYELLYNDTYPGFFDYNVTSSSQNVMVNGSVAFSPAQYYPFWTGALPEFVKFNTSLINAIYEPIRTQLRLHPGGIAASNITSGQQWDAPSVWAPLQYIIIKGALNTAEGGNSTAYNELQSTALTVAQRYLDSTYCTWRATGGSHPSLSIPQINGAVNGTIGTMFEKYSNLAIDAVGGGGEYEVVPGFGWSNGVLIWAVETFGDELKTPECGDITANTNVALTKRTI